MPILDELYVFINNIDFRQELLVALLLSTAGKDANIVSIRIIPRNNPYRLFSFKVFVSELIFIELI